MITIAKHESHKLCENDVVEFTYNDKPRRIRIVEVSPKGFVRGESAEGFKSFRFDRIQSATIAIVGFAS